MKNCNCGLEDTAKFQSELRSQIDRIENIGKQVNRHISTSNLVGAGAGITAGVLCKKKLNYGLCKSILLGVFADGVATGITYNLLELNNPTGVSYFDGMFRDTK